MLYLQPVRKIDVSINEHRTKLKRRQHRRNLMMTLASSNGASHRFIADAFDLDPSRVTRILKEYRTLYGSDDGQGQIGAKSPAIGAKADRRGR